MTSGTKIFLAIFALLIGVLVLYYGVWQKAQPLGPATASAAGTSGTATESPPAPGRVTNRRATDGLGSLKFRSPPPGAQPNQSGLLTESVESSAGRSTNLPPSADASLDSLAAGTISPPASAPAANMPLAIDTATTPLASGESTRGATTPTPTISNAPPTQSPKPPPMVEYTIKAGDTGVSIAKDWFGDGNKWTLISKANPWVDFNRLKIGQKINLPPKDATETSITGSATASSAKTATKPVTMGDKTVYTVQAGDTLIKIARKHFGSDAKWEAIYEANKSIIGSDPADLKVGMKLTLPAKKS